MQCAQTRVRALTSGPPRSTAPTCRSDRDRDGADRPALVDGELAGGATTTSISPATRRTRCTKRRHGRSSEWSSAECMAEWRRGSSAVRRLRPRHGAGRPARVSRRQGGAHALERKERGGAERGCPRRAKLQRVKGSRCPRGGVNWANSKFSLNNQILRKAQLTPCA